MLPAPSYQESGLEKHLSPPLMEETLFFTEVFVVKQRSYDGNLAEMQPALQNNGAESFVESGGVRHCEVSRALPYATSRQGLA